MYRTTYHHVSLDHNINTHHRKNLTPDLFFSFILRLIQYLKLYIVNDRMADEWWIARDKVRSGLV
jgi:hypothetical protein